MAHRWFVIAAMSLAMALAGAEVLARIDAVSGTWTGEFVVDKAPAPMSVVLTLKLDGIKAVTGTFTGLPSPGDVKSGTFNPKTGALKLQLGKADEGDVLLTLEGSMAQDVAKGKVTGEANGTFSLVRKPQ